MAEMEPNKMSQLLDRKTKKDTLKNNKGFTLVELVLVVVLVSLITTLASSKFSSITGWKQESEIRSLSSLWRQLFNEAYGRGQTYRLVLDIDNDYYQVFREVPLPPTRSENVDLLSNLRTRREKERKAQEEIEEIGTIAEEYAKQEAIDSLELDQQYFSVRFRDANAAVRLSIPLEFPSLSKQKDFTEGLDIISVKRGKEIIDEGKVFFRFTPQSTSDAVEINLKINDEDYVAKSEATNGNLVIRNAS